MWVKNFHVIGGGNGKVLSIQREEWETYLLLRREVEDIEQAWGLVFKSPKDQMTFVAKNHRIDKPETTESPGQRYE